MENVLEKVLLVVCITYEENDTYRIDRTREQVSRVKRITKLTLIGIISGCVLAGFLLIIHLLTSNEAYILLFNVDYIPLLQDVWSQPGIGIVFHFVFCIVSVVALFYVLDFWDLERKWFLYVLVYVLGSAGLFFLTALTSTEPSAGDVDAWMYWTVAHLIYGIMVGVMVNRWIK